MELGEVSTADLICLQCKGGLDMVWKYCPMCGWKMGSPIDKMELNKLLTDDSKGGQNGS